MPVCAERYYLSKVYDVAGLDPGDGRRRLLMQVAGRLADDNCEVVREMASRIAARVQVGPERYFVKAFRARSVFRRCLAALGAGRAMRELKAARRLGTLGIPTPEPLAGGTFKGAEGQWELAVFRHLADVESVHDIARNEFARSRGRARREMLSRYLGPFAAFVAGIIEAGCVHTDFHGGNILVRRDRPEFYIVDLHSLRFRQAASRVRRAAGALAQLDCLFSTAASRSERLAFAKAVLTHLGNPVSLRKFARLVDGLSRKNRRRLFAKRARKCVRQGSRFVRRARRGWRFWTKRGWFDAASIKLPEWFDTVVPEGKLLKAGHTTTVFEVPPATEGLPPVVVKRYNNLGRMYVLKHAYRRSRGLRAWRLANELEARGISTATPVAAMEFRRGLFLDRSFFAAAKVTGGMTTVEYITGLGEAPIGPEKGRRLVRRVGHLLRRLHDAGLEHRDLKPSNVLVVEGPTGPVPVLVDLDGVRRRARVSARRRAKNLARFVQGLEDSGIDLSWTEQALLAGYVGPFDRHDRQLVKLAGLVEKCRRRA